MKKTNNKGFSLVELIIVIAIMAVLIGVLAPTFTKYVERSRKSTDVQNVESIITALETYAADPMVTTNFLTNGATITLSPTVTTVSATNATNGASFALDDAGIKEIGLKSKDWGATTGGSITLTVTVANGAVTVASSGEATGNNIIKGIYK